MKERLYTIGQVSEMIDVPVKTIRYYESIGLCAPSKTDRTSSYRYYSVDDIFRLDLIRCLGRQLGMPLKTIRFFLEQSGRTDDEMIGVLKAQENELDGQIRKLMQRKEIISRKISAIEELGSQKTMEPELVKCAQTVLTVQKEDIRSTEEALLKARRMAALNIPEESYEVYVIVEDPRPADVPQEVLVGVRGSYPGCGLPELTLPEGPYVQLRFLNRRNTLADVKETMTEYLVRNALRRCGAAVFSGNILNATSASSQGYCLTIRIPVEERGPEKDNERP